MDITMPRIENDYGPERQAALRRSGDNRSADVFAQVYDAAKEKIAKFQDEEFVSYPALSEDSTKQEIIDHLITVHGMGNRHVSGGYGPTVNVNTKATKADLLALHDRIHAKQDEGGELLMEGSVGWYVRQDREVGFTLGGFPLPKVRHDHSAITSVADVMGDVDPSMVEAASQVRDGKKVSGVLNSTERKVLGMVVDNDFGQLKQEMRAFVSDSLASKKAEINAEWDAKEKAIPDFATQATDLLRKQEQDREALIQKHRSEMRMLEENQKAAFKKVTDKAEAKGVSLTEDNAQVVNPTTKQREWMTVFKAEVTGRKEAIREAEKESREYLDRALMTLEKQRLTAQRQVLLSGVPEKAMTILDQVPSARDLMVQAAKDQPQQITS